MDDLIEYLRSKGLQVHKAAGREVTVHCPFCSDGDPKGKGKLYANTETWLWDCKRCGNHGGRKMLLEAFGDQDESPTFVPGTSPAARRLVLTEYTALGEQLLASNDAMMMYLLKRGLDADTILEARLGYAPRGFGMCRSLPTDHTAADLRSSGMVSESGNEFHQGKILIPYLQRDEVLQVRGKDPTGKYFTPAGDSVRLYGADDLRGADVALVTEGEFDRLIVRQHLATSSDGAMRRIAVVGLPGAGSWPGGAAGFPDYFRDCKRVYLALDPDDVGRREALKMKEAIGAKCRIVELPDEMLTDVAGEPVKCDWTEFLRERTPDHPYGGHSVKHVAALIDAAEMSGKRMYSTRESVSLWRKEQAEDQGMGLGWPSLDAIFTVRPGNLVIPMAMTGVGKTVFSANIAYNLRARRGLYISLEQTASEITEILLRMHRFQDPTAEPEDLHAAMPWLAIVDENKLDSADFALLMEEYRDQFGERPEYVVVDYLQYYSRGQRGESYERTGAAVMQLKAEAKNHRVVTISPSQVSRGAEEGKAFVAGKARDSGVVEETADFALGLFRPGDAIDAQTVEGHATSALSAKILKSRRGGKNKIVPLKMSAASLRIVDGRDTRACAQVEQENAQLNRGMLYADILAEQRSLAFQRRQSYLKVVGA